MGDGGKGRRKTREAGGRLEETVRHLPGLAWPAVRILTTQVHERQLGAGGRAPPAWGRKT